MKYINVIFFVLSINDRLRYLISDYSHVVYFENNCGYNII